MYDFDITIFHEESLHCLFFRVFRKLEQHYESRKVDGSLPILGGVSDMTAFHNFSQLDNTNALDITKITVDKKSCDYNINVSDGYEMDKILNIKKILKLCENNNIYPHCIEEKDKERIRFLFLHFQGSAKNLITEYYLGKKIGIFAFLNLRRPIKKILSLKRYIINKIKGGRNENFV